ncbi:MAG: class I SAM-dependent methyltransferase [Acidimicrobiaceae bacterium]|nr:class I SAM-dependent methyltransferase [Acidimicrobiaceae bacterium]
MSTKIKHPIFARIYQRLSASMEAAGVAEHRKRLLTGLVGRVVEVGAGNGLNFSHYPDTVTEVIAIEPEPYLRARAVLAAQNATVVKISVIDGDAEHLPLDDASVDCAVASLVLCSVPNQSAALAEIRRVLRPGGELRFYEHVRASNMWLSRFQRLVDPIWTRFAGGCRLTRNTLEAIQAAGFVVDECEQFLFQPRLAAKIAAPHILGRAHKS